METIPHTTDELLRHRLEEVLEGHLSALYRLNRRSVPEDLGYDLYYVAVVDNYRDCVKIVTNVAYDLSLESHFDPHIWIDVIDDLEDLNDDAAVLASQEGTRI